MKISTVTKVEPLWFLPYLDITFLVLSILVLGIVLYYRYFEFPKDNTLVGLLFTDIGILWYNIFAALRGTVLGYVGTAFSLIALIMILLEIRDSFAGTTKRKQIKV